MKKSELLSYIQEQFEENGTQTTYDIVKIYNNVSLFMGLKYTTYGCDSYEDEDHIYCYVDSCYGSIVFEWNCNYYDDVNFPIDLANYLIEMERKALNILKQLKLDREESESLAFYEKANMECDLIVERA